MFKRKTKSKLFVFGLIALLVFAVVLIVFGTRDPETQTAIDKRSNIESNNSDSKPSLFQELIKAKPDEKLAKLDGMTHEKVRKNLGELRKALLTEQSFDIRKRIIQLIAGLGKDEEATKALTKTLMHHDKNTRVEVLRAIKKVGDPRAFQDVVNYLKEKEHSGRYLAIDYLAELRSERGLNILLSIIRDEVEDSQIRIRAFANLARFKNTSHSKECLDIAQKYCSSSDVDLSSIARTVLSTFQDK